MTQLLRFGGDAKAQTLLHNHQHEAIAGEDLFLADANALAPLYYMANSRDFSPWPLTLAKEAGLLPEPEACASFLNNGVFYGDAAINSAIKPLRPGEQARVTDTGIELKATDPCSLWNSSRPGTAQSLVAGLLEAVEPLRGMKVLCDLTGGLDSRLVALALKTVGIPFTGTVAGAETSPDVVLARRVARMLDVELLHDQTEAPDNVETWRSALLEVGGCVRVRAAARLAAVYKNRGEFEVAVGGLGGELLRDFWWLQDPVALESDQKPDWLQLVKYRLHQAPLPSQLLRGEWAAAVRDEIKLRAEWFDRETCELPLHRKRDLLDYAYLRLHIPRWIGSFMTLSLNSMYVHQPLLHPAVLQTVFNASSSKRCFARLVREALTILDRNIAAVPIESGGNGLALSPLKPWRYLPLYARLLRSVTRRLPFTGRSLEPVWGDRPLPLDQLTARGIVDPQAVRDFVNKPGSLQQIDKLVTLELLFQELG